MAAWGYPGRQQRQPGNRHYTQPRWGRPGWKSLAWATQLLAALGAFFVVMIHVPVVGDVMWWFALVATVGVFVLVSVLAVR